MQRGFFIRSSGENIDDDEAFDQFMRRYLHHEPPADVVERILQTIRNLPLPGLSGYTHDLTSTEHLTVYHDRDIPS